jgi:hypothetical protein
LAGTIAFLALTSVPSPAVIAQAPTPDAAPASRREPRPPLPAPAPGTVPIPFSVASPRSGKDRRIVVLTNQRSCGTWLDEPAATAYVAETLNEVWIRVDAAVGPDGEPCPSSSLVRTPVDLSVPLRLSGGPARRTIRDAGATPGVLPIVNRFEAFDTGFRYSCAFGAASSVADMAGPGLDVSRYGLIAPIPGARAVYDSGDLVVFMGQTDRRNRVDHVAFAFGDGAWTPAGRQRCAPRAVMVEGIDAATWTLRGRRPRPEDRTIRIWVQEQVCNGSPIRPRVVQPIIQWHDDAFVIVMATSRYPTDPVGRASAGSSGSYSFIDCPGNPAVPYVVQLPTRIGGRVLYDGGVFPPRLR